MHRLSGAPSNQYDGPSSSTFEAESFGMRNLAEFVFAVAVMTQWGSWTAQADDVADAKTRKSVVKIFAKLRGPDVYRPWTKTSPRDVVGSGVVIPGKRILTNSHLVNQASEIFIQPDKSSERISAEVEVLSPPIDLAVLKVSDESFFGTHPPLRQNPKLPAVQQTALVYGYPEGGTEMSITRGIVSRVEFAEYYMSTEGLRIQVDSAINPGNSGGPALVDGQMIGVVFSKLQQADNIGYIIPMEEIQLFLDDVKDGHCDGKPVVIDEFQNLVNDALRAKLKLDKKASGVMVRRVHGSAPDHPLKAGDVVTRIGEHSIDNAGLVQIEGDRLVKFQYLVQRLTRDSKLPLTIIRNGEELKLDLPVRAEANRWLVPILGAATPSYFIYGPLVFTEASDDYLRYVAYNDEPGSRILANLYTGNSYFTRYGDRPAFPGERIVIVAHPMFTHKISKGYNEPYADTIAEVNGTRIRNLEHMVEILRDLTGEFVEFKFGCKGTDTIVFRRQEALDATEEVLSDNGIRQQCSADIAAIWKAKKTK
jgi:S1-C subfamily serine protease